MYNLVLLAARPPANCTHERFIGWWRGAARRTHPPTARD